jgi:hypothetical protein
VFDGYPSSITLLQRPYVPAIVSTEYILQVGNDESMTGQPAVKIPGAGGSDRHPPTTVFIPPGGPSHNSPTAPIKAARFLVQRENRINVHARALPYRPLPIRPLWPPASASPPPDQHASGEFNATPSRATGRGATACGDRGEGERG